MTQAPMIHAPMIQAPQPLLALQAIHFGYAGREILRGLDLSLHAGQRLGLTGANGAGKSTLLRLIMGLLHPSAGRLDIFGQPRRREADFRAIRGRLGLVFQDADDQLFCPRVLDDVAFGPLNLDRGPIQARADAEACLEQLGLSGFGQRLTHQLSAGEKRLVALAGVLAMRPEVLLLDEPSSGLDEAGTRRLQHHLAALPQAMVIVSHDPAFLEQTTNSRLRLHQGRLLHAL